LGNQQKEDKSGGGFNTFSTDINGKTIMVYPVDPNKLKQLD